MGAELVYVDADRSHIPPMMWRFLIADDMSVDVFIVRDTDCRLNDRDFTVVSEWLRTDYAFHCIRDHPSHAGYSLLGGLWGGRPWQLRLFVSVPWRDMMMGYRTDYGQDMQFLGNAIWPLVQSRAAYCHDSVSCLDWPGAHQFPVARVGTEHLGQVFDAFGNAREEDLQILLEHRPLPQCSVASKSVPQKTPPTEVNKPEDSSMEIAENDEQDDVIFEVTTEPTNDDLILNSYNTDATVLHQLKNASGAVSEILTHNSAVETRIPSLKEQILPLGSRRITRPNLYDDDNQVQNVRYDSSMRVNRTFTISDGS